MILPIEAREPLKTANDGDDLKSIVLADGARVVVGDRTCVIADPAGRVLVRYRGDGSLELANATGDITLAAPQGRVVLTSGEGVEVDAPAVDVRTGKASLTARAITTTAIELTQTVDRIEVRATRILERARDVFRDASGLVQERAGQLRTLVQGTLTVQSGETTMLSERETTIDGSKIHLG
ncbi:MAG: DUF3540 domain-containing protein [Polyangiaceae bacterium]